MKKITLISATLLMSFLLAGCTAHHTEEHAVSQHSTSSSKKHPSTASKKNSPIKLTYTKKYKGFKLATIPTQYRGTWYHANAYEKNATKLVITTHTINGAAAYQQTDPNLKLNRHSEKQNKEYAAMP